MITSSAPATSFRGVLSNRNFLRIWLARGCGQIGVTAVNFALIVLVQTVTHSSTAISGIILAFYVPAVLFAGLAGVLADRLPKRTIMVVTTGLRAAVLASLIVVSRDWPWPLLLGFLYLATFLFSLLSQFNGPAEGALLPRLVGRHRLIPANALLTIGFSAAQFLGFTVLGPILAEVTGWRGLVVAATLLYLVSTVLIAGLPGDEPSRPLPARRPRGLVAGVWQDVRQGIGVIAQDRLLTKAIGYLVLTSSAGLMLATIAPAFVTRVLGMAAGDLGLILAPGGLGLLAGILLVTRLARPDNRERMIDRGLLLYGAATLVVALIKPAVDMIAGPLGTPAPSVAVVAVALLAVAVLGGSSAAIVVPSYTLLQERTPGPMRARVYATLYTVSSAAALGPVLGAGVLGDLVGVGRVVLVVALTLLIVGAVSLRRAGRARPAPAQK